MAVQWGLLSNLQVTFQALCMTSSKFPERREHETPQAALAAHLQTPLGPSCACKTCEGSYRVSAERAVASLSGASGPAP